MPISIDAMYLMQMLLVKNLLKKEIKILLQFQHEGYELHDNSTPCLQFRNRFKSNGTSSPNRKVQASH